MHSARQISELHNQVRDALDFADGIHKQVVDAAFIKKQIDEQHSSAMAFANAVHRQTKEARAATRFFSNQFDTSHFMDSISRLTGPSLKVSDLINGWDISPEVRTILNGTAISSAVQAMREQQQFPIHADTISSSLITQMTAHLRSLEHINVFSDSLNQLAHDFPTFETPSFTEEGKVATEAVAQSLASDSNATLTPEEFASKVIQLIQAQEKPADRIQIWFMVVTTLLFLMQSVVDAGISVVVTPHIEQLIGGSPQETKKNIKEDARKSVETPEHLDDYRFVSAKSLIVRESPKATSRAITSLELGSSVKLLRKEQDFAFIAWRSRDSDAVVQGWVFARYLEKY